MIKALLFDMDGTLVDSEPFYYERKKRFLLQEQLPCEDAFLQKYTGRNIKDLFADLFVDAEISSKYYERYCAFIAQHPAPYQDLLYPEVKTVLEEAKKSYQLALVSSSPWENINEMLDQCGLRPYFDLIVSGSDVAKAKPAPDLYEKAMKILGYSPEECIVIEDSYSGIVAGKQAGCKVVVRGKEHPELAWALVSDLTQLFTLLK